MARKVALETNYLFNPATRTVTFYKYVPQERLILITDVTANKVIYNFSDPSLGYSSYNSVVNNDGTESTVIVLIYNTSALGSGDEIQVTIDEFNERFTPSEEDKDPVGKLRTSSPQALIDTDFEYGVQSSKWETVAQINNRPAAYQFNQNALTLASVTTTSQSKTVTVGVTTTTSSSNTVAGSGTTVTYSTTAAHNLTIGQYITVTGFATVTGYNVIAAQVIAIPSTTSFTIYNSTTGTPSGTGTITGGVVPPVGTTFQISDTYSLTANGNYVIESRASESTFTYTAKAATPAAYTGSIFDPNKTAVLISTPYSGAFLPLPASMAVNATTGAITVVTQLPHGLSIGNEIAIFGATAATNAASVNGNNSVATVLSPTSFVYYPYQIATTLGAVSTTTTASGSAGTNVLTLAATTNISVGMIVTGTGIPTGTYITSISATIATLSQVITTTLSTTSVTAYVSISVRPQGQSLHRAFDGGVLFTAGSGSNNVSIHRQTRRYFRYQSGKGIMMSSGTMLKPTYNLDLLSASGTTAGSTITVNTKERHYMQPGYQVSIFGVADNGYNGTYSVAAVTGLNSFTVLATQALATTGPNGPGYVAVVAWTGAANRLGLFDHQNGAFFEFDGSTLYAVRRQSVFQIQGRSSVVQGSTNVTGSVIAANTSVNGTSFTKQLTIGDFVVIRGQSYRVTDIQSDTTMTINPAYRGVSADQVVITKTVNTKIAQSSFNIDQLDGHGPSGYLLDLSKMQMFYVDYSWYGAGAVRWGFRTARGNIFYVHKMQNNNSNATSYMRSGNLPGRYESTTFAPITTLSAGVAATDSTINVASTVGFPSSGTLAIRGATNTASISITGISVVTAGLVRYATGSTSGLAAGQTIVISGSTTPAFNGMYTIANTISANTYFEVYSSATGATSTATGTVWVQEYVNYTGTTTTSFTGLTRGSAGITGAATTVSIAVGSNTGTVTSTTGIQVGQRVIGITTASNYNAFPDGTFVTSVNSTTSLTFSQAAAVANPTVFFPPMGQSSGQVFSYVATTPTAVELAYPSFSPSISHWGTSVIMDGRFDDDKSLLFTYGQTTSTALAGTSSIVTTGTGASSQANVTCTTTGLVPGMWVSAAGINAGTYITAVGATTVTLSQNISTTLTGTNNVTFSGGNTKALMSIRIAPSVDSGIASGSLGARELINRMQLQLKTFDISLIGTATGNVLVQAYLNGTPIQGAGGATAWTNAIKNAILTPNSSLAQIADYAGGYTTVVGGEVTGGFFVSSTGTQDASGIRDLGNCLLGGGTAYSSTGIYPDGPDVLTIVVTNLAASSQSVISRISWTEAQA